MKIPDRLVPTGTRQVDYHFQYLLRKIKELQNAITAPEVTLVIGTPTDASWTDGYFDTWVSTYLISDALDDISEFLLTLAPTDAESLDGKTLVASGVTFYTGKLSAGNTNYKAGGGAGSLVSYISNDTNFILSTPDQSTCFNKANEGTLNYYLNTLRDTIDMTQTGALPWAGATTGELIVDVRETYGFPTLWLGNADITVGTGDLRQGYSAIYLNHVCDDETQTTTTTDVFYDNDSGANPSVNTPTIVESSAVLKYLSGVGFYNAGSVFHLGVVGSDCFDNAYHQTSPLTWTWNVSAFGSGDIVETDGAVTGLSTPPAVGETMTVTNKDLTIASGNNRSINARVTVTPRDPYGSYTAGQSASANRMIDCYGTTSDNLHEYFDDEYYRLPLTFDFTNKTATITSVWVSADVLVNGNAQVYNGTLYYPSINFSSGYLPTNTANYSGFNISQVYRRTFYELNSYPHSHGIIELGGITIDDLDEVGEGNINIEIQLPTQTGLLDACKPFDYGTWTASNGDGCMVTKSNITGGVRLEWTSSTKSTINSNGRYYIQVTIRNSSKYLTYITEDGDYWS